jgi:hypothetical protein
LFISAAIIDSAGHYARRKPDQQKYKERQDEHAD